MVAHLPMLDLDGPQVLADRIASRLPCRSFRAWHGRDPLVDPRTPPSVTAQASTITCGEADSAAGLRIPVPAFRPRSRGARTGRLSAKFKAAALEGAMAESSGLDDVYKLALGQLVIETSKLESKLTEIIAALVGMSDLEALILVHPAPFAQKVDMLTALYRLIFLEKDDPDYAPIKEMLQRITDVSDFRNSVVHALWQIGEDGVPQAVRFRRRGCCNAPSFRRRSKMFESARAKQSNS
jgi:hypothetical protein